MKITHSLSASALFIPIIFVGPFEQIVERNVKIVGDAYERFEIRLALARFVSAYRVLTYT